MAVPMKSRFRTLRRGGQYGGLKVGVIRSYRLWKKSPRTGEPYGVTMYEVQPLDDPKATSIHVPFWHLSPVLKDPQAAQQHKLLVLNYRKARVAASLEAAALQREIRNFYMRRSFAVGDIVMMHTRIARILSLKPTDPMRGWLTLAYYGSWVGKGAGRTLETGLVSPALVEPMWPNAIAHLWKKTGLDAPGFRTAKP